MRKVHSEEVLELVVEPVDPQTMRQSDSNKWPSQRGGKWGLSPLVLADAIVSSCKECSGDGEGIGVDLV